MNLAVRQVSAKSPGLSSIGREILIALLAVGAALGLRQGINEWFETDYVFGMFYVAVAVAASVGGLRSGLMALAGAALTTAALSGVFAFGQTSDLLEVLLFVAGGALICLLLENRARSARAAEESRAILDALLEALPVGVALLDRDMRYVTVNNVLARMNGQPRERHIGHTVSEVLPQVEGQVREAFRRALNGGYDVPVEVRCEVPGGGGMRVWRENWFQVRLDARPVRLVGAIVEDVTEQRQAQESLAHANRRKEETLAVIAHELRNPLGVIANAHRLLASGRIPSPEGALALIDKQVKFIGRLLDDLLDIARLNTGKVNLQLLEVDLRALVRDAVDVIEASPQARRQTIQLDLPPQAVTLQVDPQRLRQVVINLLSNASKFSPADGRIQVSMQVLPAEVRINVRDWGVGMAQESVAQAFEKWQQLDGGGRGGLGLGLALVRGLVELHGGSVTAESEGRGHGCVFTVVLPVRRVAGRD